MHEIRDRRSRKLSRPPGTSSNRRCNRSRGVLTDTRRRQIAGALLQVSPHDLRRDEPPTQQRAKPRAEAPFAELREHQRHIVVLAGMRAGDAKRAIQRLFHETRQFGVVGQGKPGIDVGFERKLSEQRQAKRVDRRDVDVAQSITKIAPATRVELR